MDRSLQLFLLNLLSLKKSMLDAIQSHGPIHGTRIDIRISDLLGKIFCHGTFATGRVAVYSDNYFLHIYINV